MSQGGKGADRSTIGEPAEGLALNAVSEPYPTGFVRLSENLRDRRLEQRFRIDVGADTVDFGRMRIGGLIAGFRGPFGRESAQSINLGGNVRS